MHRFAQSRIRLFAHSPVHRVTYSANMRWVISPIRFSAASPIHLNTESLIHLFSHALIRRSTHSPDHAAADSLNRTPITEVTGYIQRDGGSTKSSKQARPARPHIDRSRPSFLSNSGKSLQITEMPGRPGDHRPSGETAIGIPIAYPAIFHPHVRPTCPTRQCCCESSDDATAITGVQPVIRGGGIARGPDMVVEDVEANRPREQSGCP